MNQIDLGRKYPTCEPSPMDAKSKDEPRISYPSLYLDDIEGLGDLPEGIFNLSGKAKVIRRTKTERDGRGQEAVPYRPGAEAVPRDPSHGCPIDPSGVNSTRR